VGTVPLKPLGKGCKITYIPTETPDRHNKRWVRIARVETTGAYTPFAHYDCVHNQIAALRNRVLAHVPEPTNDGLSKLRTQARRIIRYLPNVPEADLYDMPNHYHGAKRERYIRAADDLLNYGLDRIEAKVKMFVKFEKLNSTKVNPDPRAIQFRHPKYCVAVGKYLKPMEEYLYRLHGDGTVLPATRVIGKGLSSDERAELLRMKMREFTDVCVLSLDASRFDQHVSRELLEIEHSIYLAMNDNDEFRMLLSWQLDNKGVSSLGIKYKCRGRRMSGDMNTALGNCLLMVLMVSCFMYGKKYDILDDGDDCLLLIERQDQLWVETHIMDEFLSYGMELKVENVAYELEGVEWCQCKPIQVTAEKVRFIRSPHKVMSAALGGTKYFVQEGARRKLVNTIGMAELILNLGVPVLQEFALALMRNAATTKSFALADLDSYFHRLKRELSAMNMRQLARVQPVPITDEARQSFFLAYGMTWGEQLALEGFLSRWVFRMDTTEIVVGELDVPRWEWNQSYTPELHSVWDDNKT